MRTQCYAMVRGSALRVTGLTRAGALPDTIQYAVSRSVAKVTINESTEAGGSETLRSSEEDIRLHFVKNTQMTRFTTDIEFLRCDPGVLSLVAGVPLVTNAAGVVVGFDSDTKIPATSFAMEVWSQLAGNECGQGEVTLGGFGEGAFGDYPFGLGEDFPVAPGRQWGYAVVPWLKGGVLSGFKFQNGLVSFNLRGAQTRRVARWGVGPYDLEGEHERLLEVVSRNTLFRTQITRGTPPTEACGIQETTDVIEGGDAGSTSDDIVDGEFVDTSIWIIEGGRAV